MAETLDSTIKELLSQYLAEVRSLPNESAKTHRFAALVGQAFPGSAATSKLTAGIEKAIRIQLVRRIEALPVPAGGESGGWQIKFLAKKTEGDGKACDGSPGQQAAPSFWAYPDGARVEHASGGWRFE